MGDDNNLKCRKTATVTDTTDATQHKIDGPYVLIVTLRGWTVSRHVINLNQ